MQVVIINRSYLLPHMYSKGTIVDILIVYNDSSLGESYLVRDDCGYEQLVLLSDVSFMMPYNPS
jgi:hypothetical protein